MEASMQPVSLQPKKLPKSRDPDTADSKFWRRFKAKITEQQIAGVTCVNFCPAPPHDFAVTSSTRVVIFDGTTCVRKKTISKFTDVAYSGSFRSDGQLLVAGGETGLIQLFDINNKDLMNRKLKGHTRAVRWVRFPDVDKLHVLSASDDNTARWWDVATQASISVFSEHEDYVRCGDFNPASQDIWATGSYDHSVCLWDGRAQKSVLRLQHGKPVEDVMFFPSGGILATAGGNHVKIWDIFAGGKLLHTLGNHQKTVTKLALANPSKLSFVDDSPRLLTASLDGHLKVFDTSEFKVCHQVKYPDPILSMGVSPACTTLAVGTASGLLSVRQRTQGVQPPKKDESQLRANNFRYFLRGRSEMPSDEDYVLSQSKKGHILQHDKLLLKFRYKDSLVKGLKTMNPTVVLAIMEEMIARERLLGILPNMDQEELDLLLTFLTKNITAPAFSRFLIPLTTKVLEICGTRLGASDTTKKKVSQLQTQVRDELELQSSLQVCQGMLQTLIQASVS